MMFGRRKGLFGAPMMIDYNTPGIAGPMTENQPAPVDTASASPAAQAIAPSTATPFTPKRNFLDKLGLVADAFSGNHNNADQLAQRDQSDFAQFQQQMAPQMAAAARQAKFEDWRQQHDYEVAHPKQQADDVFTRSLAAAGIDPASPQGQALYRQRVQTLANPAPQWIPDGMGGGRFVAPPSPGGMSGPPSAPVGKLTPMGGATSGSRSFPIR